MNIERRLCSIFAIALVFVSSLNLSAQSEKLPKDDPKDFAIIFDRL